MILCFLIKCEAYLLANAKGFIPSLSFFTEMRGHPLSHIPGKERALSTLVGGRWARWSALFRMGHKAGQKRRQLARSRLCGFRL